MDGSRAGFTACSLRRYLCICGKQGCHRLFHQRYMPPRTDHLSLLTVYVLLVRNWANVAAMLYATPVRKFLFGAMGSRVCSTPRAARPRFHVVRAGVLDRHFLKCRCALWVGCSVSSVVTLRYVLCTVNPREQVTVGRSASYNSLCFPRSSPCLSKTSLQHPVILRVTPPPHTSKLVFS